MSKPTNYMPLLIAIIFACQTISAITHQSWLVAALSILSSAPWAAVYYVKEKKQ